jgi:type II secretory pathway component HofQ
LSHVTTLTQELAALRAETSSLSATTEEKHAASAAEGAAALHALTEAHAAEMGVTQGKIVSLEERLHTLQAERKTMASQLASLKEEKEEWIARGRQTAAAVVSPSPVAAAAAPAESNGRSSSVQAMPRSTHAAGASGTLAPVGGVAAVVSGGAWEVEEGSGDGDVIVDLQGQEVPLVTQVRLAWPCWLLL